MTGALPDEYQDGLSEGSLVRARRCWLDLTAAGSLRTPQRFTFAFQSRSLRMALGLTTFLRYAEHAGLVRTLERTETPDGDRWRVVGTTLTAVWSLASLEHLFMRMRSAAARYDCVLESLERVPIVGERL
jgi:hypothetical protein